MKGMEYYYFFLTLFILISIFLIWAFIQEIKHRKQPYYKNPEHLKNIPLSEIKKPVYSVALLGDIGDIKDFANDQVMQLVTQWMDFAGKEGTLILLGDNIYPRGLPPENHRLYAASEQKLKGQLEIFQKYAGRVTYVSGNHDWNKARADGYSYILRQQEYVHKYLNKLDSFLPLNGCPGPVDFPLAPGLRLIIINTQWWVQRGIRPIGKAYNCSINTEEQFFEAFQKLLEKYKDEQIILAAHHPLYSNAQHGGKFTVKQHIFPLTAVHKKMYVPLPVAGSVYPVYRKFFGAYEDMSHPRYRRLRKKLLKILKDFNNIIYAAGHDHNLQYFARRGNHFLVSGSGSKLSYVKKGGKASFTHEHKGFFTVDYYHENEVYLRAIEADKVNAKTAQVIFECRLR